jgi:hypothetical protein
MSRSLPFAELLIDGEEDRTLSSVCSATRSGRYPGDG